MPGTESFDSAELPPHQSIYTAYDVGDEVSDDSDVVELMKEIGTATTALDDYREEGNKDVHRLWAGFRALRAENGELRIENEVLRAELREVQLRISDMCAAVAGHSDAKDRVRERVLLEQRRDALVQVLTDNRSWNWDAYVNSLPEGLGPYAAVEALHSAAKSAIPHFEARARIPQPVRTDSVWKTIAKCRMKEEKRAREAIEAEYTKRVQEAEEAQRALALLKDEGIWRLLMQK